MSYPNISNIIPTISITTGQTVPMLLASIALEELSLAHIMNAEAEKLQFVLGTLTPTSSVLAEPTVSIENLLAVDASVQQTLRDVIKKEMLLEFKFENVFELISFTQVVPPVPPLLPCGCRVTNETGVNPFEITRGQGQVDVTYTGGNARGNVDYIGILCSSCSPTSNAFRFVFTANPAQSDLGDFTFTATTFNVSGCEGNTMVTITGQGEITAGTNVFGPNPTYTLTVIEQNTISLTITGAQTFTATVTNLGNGEILLSNCP